MKQIEINGLIYKDTILMAQNVVVKIIHRLSDIEQQGAWYLTVRHNFQLCATF